MAIAPDLGFLDVALPELDRLGFRGWGELGITGRRNFTKDTDAGKRMVQLHCFSQGSPHVERHLAFRDYLRAHPEIASDYETEKRRCTALFPENSHSYSDCKAEWIIGAETAALRWYRGQRTLESPGWMKRLEISPARMKIVRSSRLPDILSGNAPEKF